jgi:hypothetical protein
VATVVGFTRNTRRLKYEEMQMQRENLFPKGYWIHSMYRVRQAIQRQGGFLLTQVEATSITVGEKVTLSYSDLSNESTTVAVVNDNTVEVNLRGFLYHISVSDFADFVCNQVAVIREIGC